MLLKKSTLVLLVLALVATSVTAQTLGDFIPMAAEPVGPAATPAGPGDPVVVPPGGSTGGTTTTPPTSTTTAPTTTTTTTTDPVVPTNPPASTDTPVVPPVVPSTSSSSQPVQPTQPGRGSSSRGAGTGTGIVTTGSATATVTTSTPTPTGTGDKASTGASLATAGIVVGSVVVAAAIGIWVFRKWKLSPSRDFQRKIGGDDYQEDYPRTYESDTVFLRNLGDQPAEPAPTKSPYNANASLPTDDQYYDAGYANDAAAQGGYGHGGHDAYGQQQAPYDHQGYDHSQGYDHGYDNTAYGAGQHDYGGSQVGGGYGGSQVGGGYGGSQVGGYGGQDAGYAHSNVGGGYQHQGYEDYGHGRR